MELQPQLMIAPSEIVFRGPYTQMTRSSFQLHNPAHRTMAFKLLTTAAAKFQVAPPNGIVLPGQTITIQVALQPILGLDGEFLDGDKFNWRKQKFAVRSAACHHDTTDPLVVINSSPPEKLMEVKVPCRFDRSDSGSSTRVGPDASLMFQEDGGRGKSGGHSEGDSSFGSDFGASTGSTVFKTVFGMDEPNSHSSDEDTGAINHGKGPISNSQKGSSNGTSSKSSNEDERPDSFGKGSFSNGQKSSSNGSSGKSSNQDEGPASYGKGTIPNSTDSTSTGSSGKSSKPDERPASSSGKGPSQSTSKRSSDGSSGSAPTTSSHWDPLIDGQATESDALGSTTLALTSAVAGSGVAGKSKGEPSRSAKVSSHKSAHGSGVEKPPPMGGQAGEDPLEQLMAPPVLLFAAGLLLLIVFLNLIL